MEDDPRWRGYELPPTSNANYGWVLTMASKLSENGVAGFLLANGALSGGGEEYKIRKKLVENGLVEAVVILPRNMFYTTDISVTLWILNKNKESQTRTIGDVSRNYRNRKNEVLFMDLRQIGEPFEKKYIQFSEKQIENITQTYHNWQQKDSGYEDVPEYCYSAHLEEIQKKEFSLVPSKYIEFVNRDEDIDFEEKMSNLKQEFTELLQQEVESKNDLLKVFKELGYEIKL